MWKKIAIFFGLSKREAKDVLKGHKDHRACDFGITQFNKTKRSKEFVEEQNREISLRRKGKPTGGGGGTTTTPPPPPPPASVNPPGVLLLTFDGYTVTGTSWNVQPTITCAPSGLTLEEIDEIVEYIKLAYAGFNLVVTTDESVFNACPINRRMRCIFTETYEFFGSGAGGTSFKYSWRWSTNDPCFVFTSLLGYVIRKIKSAGRHELGHTLGLDHQSSYNASCIKTAEYNPGNGLNSPIMGYPYALPDIWCKGQSSAGCTVIQDDVAIIKATTA